jgi:hypothetical protein
MLDIFIMRLAPSWSCLPLEEHLEEQGPLKSDFVLLGQQY